MRFSRCTGNKWRIPSVSLIPSLSVSLLRFRSDKAYLYIELFRVATSRSTAERDSLRSPGLCAIKRFFTAKLFQNHLMNSGSRLLCHTVSNAVPSAAQVLTVVFGMGTGVSPARIATGNLSALEDWIMKHTADISAGASLQGNVCHVRAQSLAIFIARTSTYSTSSLERR